MSNYLRFKTPGTTWFFTAHLAERGGTALVEHIDTLRHAYGRTMAEHPVFCDAMVVLPDHIHAVWTLPPGDSDFSIRWRKMKARFTRWVGPQCARSLSKELKREAGLWQRRFWEHQIRDDADHARHVGLCLHSPVQQGLVSSPDGWPYSTVHRDLRAGRSIFAAPK